MHVIVPETAKSEQPTPDIVDSPATLKVPSNVVVLVTIKLVSVVVPSGVNGTV